MAVAGLIQLISSISPATAIYSGVMLSGIMLTFVTNGSTPRIVVGSLLGPGSIGHLCGEILRRGGACEAGAERARRLPRIDRHNRRFSKGAAAGPADRSA